MIQEKKAVAMNGWLALALLLVILVASIAALSVSAANKLGVGVILSAILLVAAGGCGA